MSLTRPLVAAALLGGGAFLGGVASASCTGTQNTAGVCTADRTVYRDCVYAGGDTCKEVRVNAPLCVYGWIGDRLTYQTTFCSVVTG